MTAVDAAVQSRLLGAEEVTIVYRRGPEAMSASARRAGMGADEWRDDPALAARPTRSLGTRGHVERRALRARREAGGSGPARLRSRPTWCFKAIGQKLDDAPLGG